MLKGVHWTTKRLANGTVVTHYYAWRGGPKLWGTPGSVEFIHSYEEAHRNRRKPDGTVLKSVLVEFVLSKAFTEGLRERRGATFRSSSD